MFNSDLNLFSTIDVVNRSLLANNRYNLRCNELKPKPVPVLPLDVSGSNGFSTVTLSSLPTQLAWMLILIMPVVSYNPNLIAFSTSGCKIIGGTIAWRHSGSSITVVVNRCPNLTFSISRYNSRWVNSSSSRTQLSSSLRMVPRRKSD